ncbi:MAG: hypothetical protein JNM39_14775 [Bdellovibrionaceae bacterium]|nr:hypothetical protein [Pseudobdellovibrionaceae bacterium]
MKIGFVILCSTVCFMFCSFVSSPSYATPAFTNITDSDFAQITKEMSANFTHNSMMGASKLGTIFGFEVGLVGAQTGSPNTNAIAQRTAGSEIPSLYNAGVIAAVGVPFGLSAEVVMLPGLSASGSSFSSSSYALKLNMNELIPVLPINLAVRGIYSNAKFSFSQTISGVAASVDNKTAVTGVQLLLSPKLPVFEPYIGVGLLNGSNELSVTGTPGTVFDPSFSVGQSEKKTASSSQFLVGAEVSLLLIKFGAEYSQCFGASRTGIKIAVGF